MAGLDRVKEYYDRRSEDYDSATVSDICLSENMAVFSRISEIIDRIESREWPSVLDVGCGTGLALDYLKNIQYEGFDISEGMLSIACEKHPDFRDSITYRDILDFNPLWIGRFDIIICLFGVLSCLSALDCQQAIAIMSKYLKNGENSTVVLMPNGTKLPNKRKNSIHHGEDNGEHVKLHSVGKYEMWMSAYYSKFVISPLNTEADIIYDYMDPQKKDEVGISDKNKIKNTESAIKISNSLYSDLRKVIVKRDSPFGFVEKNTPMDCAFYFIEGSNA